MNIFIHRCGLIVEKREHEIGYVCEVQSDD
jgi:hypothetical protein